MLGKQNTKKDIDPNLPTTEKQTNEEPDIVTDLPTT